MSKKYVDKNSLEYLFLNAHNVFGTGETTIQQLYFCYLMDCMYLLGESFSKESNSKLKTKFLVWQSYEFPSIKWIYKNYQKWGSVKVFSHDDDFKWNDMDNYILDYLVISFDDPECNTRELYLQKKSSYIHSIDKYFRNQDNDNDYEDLIQK